MISHDMPQGSPEWFAARCGLPTASEFSKLITSVGAPSKSIVAYSYTKACEKFAGEPVDAFQGNAWTDAGTEDEAAARENYEFITGNDIIQVGFVTDDAITCGCSPDSLVNEDGMLELKRLKGSLLIEAHLYYKKTGKINPKHVQQTQGQMMICERQWCDVVMYNPLLPSLTIRVTPDAKIVAGLKSQIAACNNLRDATIAELNW